jgi:hypothetical protein
MNRSCIAIRIRFHFRFTELAVDVYGPGFGDRGYLRLEQYIFWISCSDQSVLPQLKGLDKVLQYYRDY